MPALSNPKHEAFARGLAKGLTADEAYESAGFRPHRGNAARLRANESVRRRVSELQDKAAERAMVTARDVLIGLHTEATRTGEGSSHGARVAAWAHLGKHFGMFTDKIEASVTADVTVSDARSKLQSLLSRQPAAGPASGDAGKSDG